MNADFQLRHNRLGRHGSFWGTQTEPKTREMLRELSRTASLPSRLQHVDAGGAYAVGAQKALKEGVIIDFADGHFVLSGPDMQVYVPGDVTDGIYTMIRDNATAGLSGTVFRPHKLSSLTAAEVAEMTADIPTLAAPGNWFLIPKPVEVNPIMLATKVAGVEFIHGVDFFTSKHFIITQHPPAEYFAAGTIVATMAEVWLESFDAYPSDSPRTKKGRKWVNTYAKRAQSIEIFRRAAAEFCGLYVLQHDDVVLNVIELTNGSVVYAFAQAGVVVVDYPHTPLDQGVAYQAGHVVCDQFEIRNSSTHGAAFLTSTGKNVDLSGLFGVPLQLPDDGMVECSYEYMHPATYVPILQIYFGGDMEHLQMVWATQMAHELRTGNSLATALDALLATGLSDSDTFPIPNSIDFASVLHNFYGSRLHLLVVDNIPAACKFELQRFVREHVPAGNIVLMVDMDATQIAPVAAAAPPEGNIFYAAQRLYYESDVLTYE